MKVLIADSMPQHIIDDLQELGFEVLLSPKLEGDTLRATAGEFKPDVLVVRSTKVHANVLTVGCISLVVRAGAGVNNIDIQTASKLGIYVANCPGKNAIAVAELVMGLLLALDRHIVDATVALRNNKWNKKQYSQARGIYGRTLGVIGLGAIGKEVVSRAKAFGLDIVVWSRSLSPEGAEALGIRYAATPVEVAREADIVSIHLALTSDTTSFIDKDFFSYMKHNSYFINTSRGEVVNEEALIQAIQERGLLVACDVWNNQPSQAQADFTSPLFDFNVYGTPHIGASTEQSQHAIATETLRIIKTYKEDGSVLHCVNLLKESTSNILIVRHHNKVGVLADIFGYIRAANINILEMQNVLFKEECAACATMHLNSAAGQALLNQLNAHTEVISVQVG